MDRRIVGLELDERSDGAARLGAWLHGQTQGTAVLFGVHVAHHEAFAELGQGASPTRILELFAAERAVERVGARAAFAGIEVVEESRRRTGSSSAVERPVQARS
ncbi:hypothetical protein [Nannocystis pusilla]|uniref:Uncharacterized protein n=1 Tax=Nannocystis pusilla TaxID=889268 RepID=A0ABS7U5R7_9BACT|nr:hypothetical protein [Nannocystis pusilla]MBZ5715667.1 hypothetical protein [Nannocystis pusilla]